MFKTPVDFNREKNPIDNGPERKKRHRVQRACDMCRVKRVRCGGGQSSHRPCSNCVENHFNCTYTQVSKKSNTDRAYIETLEDRLARMEDILRQAVPQENLPRDLFDSPELNGPSPFVEGSQTHARILSVSTASPPTMSPPVPVDADDVESSDDEYSTRQTLAESFKSVSMDPGGPHFFGKSSSFLFLQKAMDIRQEYVNELVAPGATERTILTPASFPRKRSKFWSTHPWVKTMKQTHTFSFPPDDLMASLIESYFRVDNLYMHILHFPTFQQSLADGLHLRDEGFAMLVLLVCALGSRSSKDPRVLLDGCDDLHSAGWKWYYQAQLAFDLVGFEPTTLYDLQIICLLAAFLSGSASPQVSWPLVGMGIRLAQARGAHRKKVYEGGPTVETELLKRAFWALVMMDRALSSGLGRPCAVQTEDFDVELPLECDDEYWINEDPALAFKQPPGKPATVAYFNCCIRLDQIHAFALRTIYSINKSNGNTGRLGHEWEVQAVSELDSALNKFIDSVPSHLRWDPHQKNILFFIQSANLYALYYNMHITVHRRFIPSPGKPARFPFPSLAICANAARSCVQVLDIMSKRIQREYPDTMQEYVHAPIGVLFNAGMVLLLNIWAGKRKGIDYAKEMIDVHKVMRMLMECNRRNFAAIRLWDLLYEMACVGRLPLPPSDEQVPSKKRAREETEDPQPPMPATTVAQEPSLMGPVTAPLTQQVFGAPSASPTQYSSPTSSGPSPLPLPVSSLELGRLPVYLRMNPSALTMSAGTSIGLSNSKPFLEPYEASQPPGEASPSSAHYVPAAFDSSSTTPLDDDDGDAFLALNNGLEPFAQDPTVDSAESPDMLEAWSTLPSQPGFNFSLDWGDWATYITNVNGFSDQPMPPSF